jgi:2-oxoglutarate ferredoxin oxidoreductase subunit gamma
MRGGTANCSVILSDSPVGSPIVANPDILLVMKLPSLDKYENSVKAGGKIFVDSTFIDRKVNRTDVDVYYIPATKMASDAGVPTLANMILLGKVIKETGVISLDGMKTMFEKIISAKRQNLIETNLKTIDMGYNYT